MNLTLRDPSQAPDVAAVAGSTLAPSPTTQAPDQRPTGAPVRRPDGFVEVIDGKGRRLALRELDIMDEQNLICAVGNSVCSNALAFGRVVTAARVAEIDGERIDVPVTEKEYAVMMKRVGREGLTAVIEYEQREQNGDAATSAAAKNS